MPTGRIQFFIKTPIVERVLNPNPRRARQMASCASSQSGRCVFAPDMIAMGLDITVCRDVMTDADKICASPGVM